MSAEFEIHMDHAAFARELDLYQRATQKDMAYVVNRAMNNWATHGAKAIKEASASRIQALESLPWWPKLVAKLMALRSRRMKVGMSTAQWRRVFKRRLRQLQGRQRIYTRAQARRRSKQIINRRLQARLFLRSFCLKWSNVIAATVPGIKGPRAFGQAGGFFRSIHATYKPAAPGDLSAQVHVWYEYKKRSGKGTSKVEAMFERAKAMALAATIRDMRAYVHRLAAQRARSYLGSFGRAA